MKGYTHRNHRRRTPLIDRVASKVALDDAGCLVWLGSINRYGYGQISVGSKAEGKRTVRQVHRALYEVMRGPVPDGLELDHLCRNRACCHPDHLEPVTRTENIRRGIVARRGEVAA